MIPLHPKFLHFPIALLFISVLVAFLAIAFKNKREFFKEMLLWTLLFAMLSAVATVVTGLIAEDQLIHNDVIHDLLSLHKPMAIALTVGLFIAFVWILWRKNKMRLKGLILHTFFLVILAGLLIYVAELGGRMVYEHGAGVIPMQEYFEKTPHEHNEIEGHSETGVMVAPADKQDSSVYQENNNMHQHDDHTH